MNFWQSSNKYLQNFNRYLLTQLGLYIQFYDHDIEADDGSFKGSIETMVDLGTYEFKSLNTTESTPE